MNKPQVRLRDFSNASFSRGRPKIIEAIWILASALLIASSVAGSAHRRLVLRLFGARIGSRVAIKPRVRIKFPWRLEVGDDSWIGEDVWIDNLEAVYIGSNVCLSQGAYICTGNHDWGSPTFDLIVKPVRVENCAWIAAKATITPGVTIGEGSVLSMGSVATSDLEPWGIYQGVPAKRVNQRRINSEQTTAVRPIRDCDSLD
jgi:putative colanic acid biosynthesis acetyltransferase WcaF